MIQDSRAIDAMSMVTRIDDRPFFKPTHRFDLTLYRSVYCRRQIFPDTNTELNSETIVLALRSVPASLEANFSPPTQRWSDTAYSLSGSQPSTGKMPGLLRQDQSSRRTVMPGVQASVAVIEINGNTHACWIKDIPNYEHLGVRPMEITPEMIVDHAITESLWRSMENKQTFEFTSMEALLRTVNRPPQRKSSNKPTD